eukprot:COSAG02_NODE_512_length_20850_cov_4.993302_7_plen_61_part_00
MDCDDRLQTADMFCGLLLELVLFARLNGSTSNIRLCSERTTSRHDVWSKFSTGRTEIAEK